MSNDTNYDNLHNQMKSFRGFNVFQGTILRLLGIWFGWYFCGWMTRLRNERYKLKERRKLTRHKTYKFKKSHCIFRDISRIVYWYKNKRFRESDFSFLCLQVMRWSFQNIYGTLFYLCTHLVIFINVLCKFVLLYVYLGGYSIVVELYNVS